jgi:hypothetical protein
MGDSPPRATASASGWVPALTTTHPGNPMQKAGVVRYNRARNGLKPMKVQRIATDRRCIIDINR